MLRNLASKSFDSGSSSSASSSSSSTGVTSSINHSGSSPDANVYDKLRLLNSGQPWSTHSSSWYVPSPGAAAAAAAVFSHHMNGQSSPSQYSAYHDPLNENHLNIHHHSLMGANEMKLEFGGHDVKKGMF